jgi:hypothetical protein
MKLGLTFAGLFLGFVTTVAQEPIPSPRQPEKLILDLDHPRFRDGDSAYQELVRMGDKAVPALRNALVKPGSAEARDRIRVLLALRRPSEFDAHFNGWHWVYSTIAHAQTFEATGATVKSLKLRVAQLSANRPTAPLEVEIRDAKLETIYLRGAIDPGGLERDFRWRPVGLKHVAPLQFGETYVLVFHSRGNKNTSPWAVNAIYRDIYPYGRHWYTHTEDFFFQIEYHEGTSVRVGPKGDDTPLKTPISCGAQGGAHVEDGGGLRLQTFGPLPAGKLKEPSEGPIIPRAFEP